MELMAKMLALQAGRIFLWCPVALAVGIAVYFSLGAELPAWVFLGLALGAFFAFGLSRIVPASIGPVMLFLGLGALGFVLAEMRSRTVATPIIWWNYYGAVEGTVVGLDRSSSDKPRLLLAEVRLDDVSPASTPRYVRVSLHSGLGMTSPPPAARVSVTARLTRPSGPTEPGGFDFQRHTWFRSIGAVGYAREPAILLENPKGGSFSERIFKLRIAASRWLQAKIPGQDGAFAAAILTGDRSAIDQAPLEDLRDSNLAHLLAISGLHMGLLTGVVFLLSRSGLALIPHALLQWRLKEIAAVVALLAATAYLFLSGMSIATQRAYVMVAVMLVAILLKRQAISLRSVAAAALIILVLRPESLLEIGFQMSFAATIALIACFGWLTQTGFWMAMSGGALRWLRGVASLAIASLVAAAATAPFAAFHFNQFVSMGVVANLASVPVMSAIVMPFAVIGMLLAPIGLDGPAFWLMGQGIAWILSVAGWIADQPIAVTPVKTGSKEAMALVLFGLLSIALWVGRGKWIGAGLAGIGFALWAAAPRPDILISDNGRLVGFQGAESRILTRARGAGFTARTWLENDGIQMSQDAAAKLFEGDPDLWSLGVGAQDVGYLWNRKAALSDLAALCKKVDFVIAPTWEEKLPSGCAGVAQQDFYREGSMSLQMKDGALKLTTALEKAGARRWNTPPPRN